MGAISVGPTFSKGTRKGKGRQEGKGNGEGKRREARKTAENRDLYQIFSERTTLRSLYAVADPSVCLSVVCRLSVTLVHLTQAVEHFGNLFSPYDSPGSLVFWCQKSLVGDAPFPLKFSFKVTDPPFK